MNHRSSGLLVSDAIEGLLLAKLAEGRSPRTITGYRHDLRVWLDYAGDKDVAHVTSQEIQAFLLYLRTGCQPRRLSRDGLRRLQKKVNPNKTRLPGRAPRLWRAGAPPAAPR